MSSSCDTSKKTCFYDFSYWHGNFSLTRVAHLTHVECQKAPRLPRKTTWAHLVTRRKRHGFATFPIGTATFTLRSFKINVFLRVCLRPDLKIDRVRLPSIFITCQKMPRLPRNLHLVTTSRSADTAIYKNMQHATSKVLRLPRIIQNAAPATKNATHLLKTWQKYCACHTNDLWHVMKHVRMSQSATTATRNEATRRWKTPKVTPFAKLLIGTAIRTSRGHLRTVANGCKRLRTVANEWLRTVADGGERFRTVANVNATSGEHSSTLTPPEWNGNPCYAVGKNCRHQLTQTVGICPQTQTLSVLSGKFKPSWACKMKEISTQHTANRWKMNPVTCQEKHKNNARKKRFWQI